MRSIALLLSILAICYAKRVVKVDEVPRTETPTLITTTESNYTDENVSIEFNTTEMYLTTTPATIFLRNESSHKKNVEFETPTNSDYCTCDLQLNICDVNCCCDSDCSGEDREIFGYCEAEPRHYDTRYCDYMKYIYINNTRFQWEINQNGLFCVIKSNLPPSFVLQRKHPLKTFEESENELVDRFSWPQHAQEADEYSSRTKLVYGSPIWYTNNNKLGKFGVPNSFITDGCKITENVNFLQDLHTSCTQVISNDNPMLSLKYYMEHAKFVSGLNTVNALSRSKENVYEICSKYNCLSTTIKVCNGSLENCTNLVKNDSRIGVQCNLNLRDKTNTCLNIVRQLHYSFYHNGSKGLTDILLLVNLGNISYEFGVEASELTQDFYVKFLWKNATRKITTLSGNPGYLIGKPILTGTLTPVENGTNSTISRKRKSSDLLYNFLTIPRNVDGECVMNSSHHTTVEFGYNVLTRCRLRRLIYNRRKSPNATEMCRELQNSTLQIWNLDDSRTVGVFGNANARKLDDWEKILYKESPNVANNRTLGAYYSKDGVISCRNMIGSLQIKIFHSRVDIGSLIDQQKILAVTFSFTYYNVSLRYGKTDNSLLLNAELETQVSFYDLTGKKTRKIVDPPSIDIKLPYDFFYPFVRINNGSVGVTHNFLFLIVLFSLNVWFFRFFS